MSAKSPPAVASETALVSVVLAPAVDVPARFAVPVKVRALDGRVVARIPADGRYHSVPARAVTCVATLPGGQVFQATANCAESRGARLTLQGDVAAANSRPRRPLPVEQVRTSLRFYLQSSIDSYARTRKPSLGSTVLAAVDEVRLELTRSPAGVQFLQLTSRDALPLNVAFAGDSSVRLVRTGRGLAADVRLEDERIALALAYLHGGRTGDAMLTLDLQCIALDEAERTSDVATAVVLMHIRLAAERLKGLSESAVRLARRHPDVADFHVISALCAEEERDERGALDALAELQQAGLPLLHRSFTQALRLLDRGARTDFAKATDPEALHSIHRRLRAVAPHVDHASYVLAFSGETPGRPSSDLSLPRRVARPFERWLGTTYEVKPHPSKREKRSTMAVNVPAAPDATPAKPEPVDSGRPDSTTTTTTLSTVAKAAAVLLLLAWLGFVVYLLANLDATEVNWTRAIFIFASVEAVAFAAAGALFGTSVTRQRAERAEQKADENQKAAEGGKALAAALKAEEPSVVHEPGDEAGGPRSLGPRGGDQAAAEIAARHARLARQLFP